MYKYTDVSNNKENANIPNYKYPCPCIGKSTLARRQDRPSLAEIQDSNHDAFIKARSKSTSSCTKIPSPIKFFKDVKPREFVDTKIAGHQPVIKAPPRINSYKNVRSDKCLNSKSIQPLAPRKASPCRCLFYADSKKPTENVNDDVFLPPATSTVISKQRKPRQPSETAKSPKATSTVKVLPNSTKNIQKFTLDSYTSIFTQPPKPDAPSLSKISSISGFLDAAAKITLETFPSETANFLFKDLDRGKRDGAKRRSLMSPMKSNVPIRRCKSDATGQTGQFKRPAVKKSLLRRRSSTVRKEIYFPILYSAEYREDIINYLYINKSNNLLENKWVTMYIAKRHRTDILNWLLEISEHYFPKFEAPYYMAYQLAAIAALWIAGKFLEGNSRLSKASKLFALCSGKYSIMQILAMERDIIKTFNFCFILPDPLDFLFNYLKLSNLENDEKLIQTSKFIIECASLFESYCLVTPSFLAASALYMALQAVRNETDVYFLWYDSERIQHFIEHVLKINVKYSLMSQYAPVRRYSEVAHLFFNI